MTDKDIEKKLQTDFDLYDIIELNYDEINKKLYISLELNFYEILISNPNKKLSSYLMNNCSLKNTITDFITNEDSRDKLSSKIYGYSYGIFVPPLEFANNIEVYQYKCFRNFIKTLIRDWKLE